MAVRQYIGARYVLKIYENSLDPQSANWESGVAYEPLTMVNYNNSSYISRKDVPANIGNPVDNPSYWALSGLYNGQIAQLQQDINDINNELDDVDDRLDVLEGQGRKFVVVGDSYAVDQYTYDHFIEVFSTLSGETNISNYAVGGASFYNTNGAKMFISQIDTKPVDTDVTDVFVCGGFNDAHQITLGNQTLNDVRSAIPTFFNVALQTYPNAKFYIGFIGSYNNNLPSVSNNDAVNFANVKNLYYNAARYNKRIIPLTDIEYVLHHMNWIGSDGIHPTQDGMEALGTALYDKWIGHEINFAGNIGAVTVTLPNSTTSQIQEMLSTSGVFLKNNGLDIVYDIPSVSLSTWYDIGTISYSGDYYTTGDENTYISIPAIIYWDDNGTSRRVDGGVILRLNLDKLQMRLFTAQIDSKHVTRVLAAPFSVEINLDRH